MLATQSEDGRTGGESSVSYSLGRSNPLFHRQMLSLREYFVCDVVGWFEPPHDDWDVYDDRDDTLHVGCHQHPSGRLITGFRLTPVPSLSESLSLSMLSAALRRQLWASRLEGRPAKQHLDALARAGALHDLTRLVSVTPTTRDELLATVGSMMRLFGFAAASIRSRIPASQIGDVRWIFATTEEMWTQLVRLGVQMQVLVAGDFDDSDKSTSYLCLVEQENAIRHIYDHPSKHAFSLTHLELGLSDADASTIHSPAPAAAPLPR